MVVFFSLFKGINEYSKATWVCVENMDSLRFEIRIKIKIGRSLGIVILNKDHRSLWHW